MDVQLAVGDVAPRENPEKVAAALARFRLHDVRDEAAFDLGYRLLDAEFGPLNEIERREVLERWFGAGSLSPADAPIRAFYYQMLAYDGEEVAAVRDGFSAVDRARNRVVALLSHSLVLPPWRRSGVASLLRAAPVAYARQAAADLVDPEILLVSEMEPVAPERPETLARMFAYARGGFRILPPWLFPYAQPDFREVDVPRPIPFLLLVRRVGHEEARELPRASAVAILDHLASIHGPSVVPGQLPDIRAHALSRLPGGPVPLLAPPTRAEDVPAALTETEVFPLYPAAWRPPAQERASKKTPG